MSPVAMGTHGNKGRAAWLPDPCELSARRSYSSVHAEDWKPMGPSGAWAGRSWGLTDALEDGEKDMVQWEADEPGQVKED